MQLYKLSRDFPTNKEWSAILKKTQDDRISLSKKFSKHEKLNLEIEDSIQMELINLHSDKKERTENLCEVDLIYWTDDLTLDAFAPPAASCAIVSEALKDLLETFHFHDHFYHPISFVNLEIDEIRKRYYMLHIIGSFIDFTDYSKSTYQFYSYRSKEIIKEEVGSFNTYEDFSLKSNELFESDRIQLTVANRVLTVDYDILWGIPSSLFVNEKIKIEVENSNLRGVGLSPLKNFKVVLPSEYLL